MAGAVPASPETGGSAPGFDRSPALYPARLGDVNLAHCVIGPMYGPAAEAAKTFIDAHARLGVMLAARYPRVLSGFREKAAALLGTVPDNVAYVSHTAEALNLVANGYPFEPGDQVIGYVHEFPSNHYPWALQRSRGVELVLLSDADPTGGALPPGRPRGWSMEELEAKTTARTRVVALSHVQFTSGYAADLGRLGSFCRERGIDLVVDAAQSLGALPVQPEVHGIAAVAASAWKWLLGPRGAALLYTTPALRDKLAHTMAGDAMMKHRLDYLNHGWDPVEDARRFEYSTLPWEHLLAIETVVEEVFLRYGMEAISREVLRHQDRLIAALAGGRHRPLVFPVGHRSGILSVDTDGDARMVAARLRERGVVATAQAGYLRLAPHFYLTDGDVERAADVLERT